MNRLMRWCILLVAGASVGCAPRDPLATWQQGVDRYIRTHGQGNIDSLRDIARARSRYADRPALATIGQLDVPDGRRGPERDAVGVLLGYRRVAAQNWYVFLVGVTQAPPQDRPCPDLRVVVDDVRLVAVSTSTGQLKWVVSEPDQTSLVRYRRGRASHAMAESRRSLFPGTFDLYELKVIGQTLQAAEKRSGASWQVVVPSSRRRVSFRPSVNDSAS